MCQTEEMERALYDCLDFLEDLPSPPIDLIEQIREALRLEYQRGNPLFINAAATDYVNLKLDRVKRERSFGGRFAGLHNNLKIIFPENVNLIEQAFSRNPG